MKYLQLIVTLLASASLVFCAPYPAGEENGICDISSGELQTFLNAINEADNPAVFPSRLEHCMLRYSRLTRLLVERLVVLGRDISFEYVLPRMHYESPAKRDRALTLLLGKAIYYNNMRMAGVILSQEFHNDREDQIFWIRDEEGPAWDLDSFKQLNSAHPEQIVDLAPTEFDMAFISSAQDAFFMIDFARHCDSVCLHLGIPAKFDAHQFLSMVVQNYNIDDADMVQVARCLLELGAEPTDDIKEMLVDCNPGHSQTIQLLDTWGMEDVIKEPGAV